MPRALSHSLDRFRALPAAQRRALLAACAWLPLFWIGLRALGLARFQALLARTAVARGCEPPPADIRALGALTDLAARRSPFPATCLTRSLLLQWMLRRRGVAAELRIGVRLAQGALDAHAWVEVAGEPVNDDPDIAGRFAPFSSLAAGGAVARYD